MWHDLGKGRCGGLGKIVSVFLFLKALPAIIIFAIVFYGIYSISWGIDSLTKSDDKYVSSSEYNEYVAKIAKEHADADIFEVEGDPVNGPADDRVTIRYTFKQNFSKEEYEAYAKNELMYLYAIFENFELKKDSIMAPKGKDFHLVFYTYENGKKKEIGLATMFYIFGKLDGDDYVNGDETIIHDIN